MEPAEKKLCSATNRQGEPCKRMAEHGTAVCHFHGAKAPQVKAKGEQRIQEENAARAAKLLGIPVQTSPNTALLQELYNTAGLVNWLRTELEAEGDIFQQTAQGTTESTAKFRVWQQERDRLVKVGEACVRAGVEERRVAIIEDQGRLMSQLLRAVLSELGIPLNDDTTRVVRRHLALLPGQVN